MTEVDVEGFRAFEHAGWEGVPDAYHRSFADLTPQAIPRLLDAVGAGPGVRLLDVCTGPGYATAAAAERGAEAVGVDFSAEMVAAAVRRNPATNLRVADAEDLPFPVESFDAVVINFGLLHLARPERALAEAFRVLRSGGRFAATVWAQPARALGFGIVLRAIREHGRTDVDLPPGPDFFRFSDLDECRRTLRATGFEAPTVEEIPLAWRVREADDVFRTMLEGTVRTAGLLRAQSESARAAIRVAIAESVQEYRATDGFELPMPAVLTSAAKP